MQFLVALSCDFEQVHAFLLYWDPFLKLKIVVVELLSEETRLGTFRAKCPTTSTGIVLAISSSTPPRQISYCYYYQDSYEISNYPMLWYKNSKANQFKPRPFHPKLNLDNTTNLGFVPLH